jgi:UPF0755 protein
MVAMRSVRRYEQGMRILITLALITMLVAFVGVGVSVYQYKNTRTTNEVTVVIAPKTGTKAMLAQLHEAGLVPPPMLTVIPMLMNADYKRLQAGEYAFATGTTPAQVIDKIARGEVVVHKITIPEGWNNAQVRAALMAEPLLTGDLPATIPEGSLLPDTMHFARGEARANVIARMQKAQTELMEKLWPSRAEGLPIRTIEEAIILASVIEKETGEVDERALVAGVFVNRLRIGMMLQSDPTVVYGIEAAQGHTPMGRPLTRGDLQRDTMFNSYMRAGLPPTPICNPGRAALEAALHPAATDALYFVATGNGGHRFAATLKEHEANVAAYRAALKAAANASSAPGSRN